MKEAIKNRYEFLYFFDCQDGNPNGDPDADNAPRMDPESGHGLVSDVAIKRRIRDYVQLAGQDIYFQHHTHAYTRVIKAYEALGEKVTEKPSKKVVENVRKWMCDNFWDIRSFGAVMSTGVNAGQVRGPVQVAISRSLDPIYTSEMCITRTMVTKNEKMEKTYENYLKWEAEARDDETQTMGRKNLIHYGLYLCRGFISGNLAQDTGFTEDDLKTLCDALTGMWDHVRSSSKGYMSSRKLFLFKHCGTDPDPDKRMKQAILGCVPAHTLLDLGVGPVSVRKLVDTPRKFEDYEIVVDMEKVEKLSTLGVEMTETLNWGEMR